MENSYNIVRKSIHDFLVNSQYLYSSCLLALPFSTAILFSQYFCLPSSSSPLFQAIFNGFHNFFEAAKLSSTPQHFSTIFTLKLSQTLTSFIISLPFNLTFLILAKSSVIQALNQSLFSVYSSILLTYICNSFVILSTNAIALVFLRIFGCSSSLLLAVDVVVYSIILAHVVILSNLSLALSGSQLSSGFSPFFQTFQMIRRRTLTALSISWPLMLACAGVEALFQYRILIEYLRHQRVSFLMVVETILIAYLYSILIVFDAIVSCIFMKSCTSNCIDDDEED